MKTKLITFLFIINVVVILHANREEHFRSQSRLHLYIGKLETGEISYTLNSRKDSKDMILSVLENALKLNDQQRLIIVVQNNVEFKFFLNVITDLHDIGWNHVDIHGFIKGSFDHDFQKIELVPIDIELPTEF